jgi:hypothetical protein
MGTGDATNGADHALTSISTAAAINSIVVKSTVAGTRCRDPINQCKGAMSQCGGVMAAIADLAMVAPRTSLSPIAEEMPGDLMPATSSRLHLCQPAAASAFPAQAPLLLSHNSQTADRRRPAV